MATARTIDNYGGQFADAQPVQDPTTEQSATYANRLHEDVAQMTRTSDKVWVKFPTTTTAGPVSVTPSAGESHAGTGSGQLPTISKTATGTYQITYASSFNDALGVSESVSFSRACGYVMGNGSTTLGHVVCEISGNVIFAYISTTLSAQTASDLGGNVSIVVEAR